VAERPYEQRRFGKDEWTVALEKALNPAAAETEEHRRIECPVCGFPIGAVRGSKEAICGNCGFKDGCC